MIAAFDVDYSTLADRAATAAVVGFSDWPDAAPLEAHVMAIGEVEAYVPGQFYRRELPCLMALLPGLANSLTVAVVDGYVAVGPDASPGLGQHFYDALLKHYGREIPVIGVAKTAFRDSLHAVEVLRGKSQAPLYVTAMGMEASIAAECVVRMHGEHRLPTMLQRVDHLARGLA